MMYLVATEVSQAGQCLISESLKRDLE